MQTLLMIGYMSSALTGVRGTASTARFLPLSSVGVGVSSGLCHHQGPWEVEVTASLSHRPFAGGASLGMDLVVAMGKGGGCDGERWRRRDVCAFYMTA